MKKIFALIAVTVLACGSCNRGTTTTTAGGGKPTIALVLKTLNHPFFVDMRRGAQEALTTPALPGFSMRLDEID